MAVIDNIRAEINDTRTYQLRLLDSTAASEYRFAAGQFNMLYLPGCGEVAISMSGPTTDDGRKLLHTVRNVGRVTEAMARLSVGDRIGLRGPYGSAWPGAEITQRDVVIVAGGLGLAPLRPLIYQLLANREQYGRLVLQLGARQPTLFLYTDEFESWRGQGLEIELIVDRVDPSWNGPIGVVTKLLERLDRFEPARSVVITCGPEIMMRYVAYTAVQRGVQRDAIWVSLERHMQCAIGLCGHCQLGSRFVCRQGPVFRYAEIESSLLPGDF